MPQDEYAYQLLHATAPERWPGSGWKRTRRRTPPSTLLVGDPHGIRALHRQLLRRPPRDFEVIGCCLTAPGSVRDVLEGLPVLGGPDDVVDVVSHYAVDAVAVLPSSGWDGATLRRIERDVRATPAELLLAPAVPETAGSRGRRPPVRRPCPPRRGRPGLHGAKALAKGLFDRAVAASVLVLLLPVLVGVAVAVKATSRGPVFVRLACEGRAGRPFHLLRFRTTGTGTLPGVDRLPAERRGDETAQARGGPADTPLGSLLRRYSVDELPQLLNVLRGDMSLVGPRPHPPSSGAPTEQLLRPGLIGLAPVGGRSGGSRVDVDYVENWSLLQDLSILRRSLVAALRGGRAA